MGGLLTLASFVVICGAYTAFRRANGNHLSPSRRYWIDLLFIPIYATTLLLALRVGARTWPGYWVPASPSLNWFLNSSELFTFSYFIVLAVVIADLGEKILFRQKVVSTLKFTNARALLRGARTLGLVWCVLIGVVGLVGVVLLKRLAG